MSGHKWPSIDVMALYSGANHKKWNIFLADALRRNDVEGIKKTLYGIQAGMDDLVKKKLNSDKVNLFFMRLQRSLENTAKEIFRKKYPNPCDDPRQAGRFLEFRAAKKIRDQEFEKFLSEARF